MKYLLIITLFLSACATAPHSHIQPPSTAPIKQHVDKAADLSKQLKDQIAIARKLAPQIPALRLALDTANGQADALTLELLGAKAEIVVLEKGNKKLADTANTAIDHDAKTQKENATLKGKLHEVNRWWGIGGILYGIKRLAGHLFILLAVMVAVGVALMILSFFFPVIGVGLSIAGSFLRSVFARVFSRK